MNEWYVQDVHCIKKTVLPRKFLHPNEAAHVSSAILHFFELILVYDFPLTPFQPKESLIQLRGYKKLNQINHWLPYPFFEERLDGHMSPP